jgi:3-mercaptopyruvate sulfurtransferase SseA
MRWREPMVAALLGLWLAGPSTADPVAPGRLVDAAWLQRHRAEVVLLDASHTQQHAAGHIPGAINADRFVHGAQDPTPKQMMQRLQSWGIDPGEKVVIYDQGADYLAPRLFYDLYYHGVPAEDIHVLDGGLARWRAIGGELTTAATPTPAQGTLVVGPVRESARVRLPEFLAASGDREQHVLVDALDPAYYFGERRFFDRAGHVPNAAPMPSADFFNADKTFRSADEIRRLMRYAGIRPGQVVHSHCGGGGAAAVPWFALRFIAGHERTTLYQESQREWLADERGLPFWTYARPGLLRDSAWLSGWNSSMLRFFGVVRLNLVDVRPSAAYDRDHLPYALNLPAEVFREHLGRAGPLAARLGPAGVNADEEVVIVSDGGLTPDAALAFLAFEQLGQRKLSLLMDSVADWGLGGQPLTREATRIGPPARPGDLAVPAAAYVARPSPAVIVAEPRATRGEFPPVFIATGRAAPVKAPDGPIVRLPWGELLDAAGRPRPAADLHKRIASAGVPRHAEVILFADDPAEAAVAYVVFRLMGWPDVKVWVD